MTPVVLNAFQIRDALNATLVSTEKPNGNLPSLQCVKVTKTGTTLTFLSTDRYRLTRVTIELDKDKNPTSVDNFYEEALIDSGDVKRFLAALPKRTTRWAEQTASLEFGEDFVGLNTNDTEVKVVVRTETYPAVTSVFTEDVNTVEEIGFKASYMVDLCKMPGRDNQPVRLTFNGGKPFRSEWSYNGVLYMHVLMPLRQR